MSSRRRSAGHGSLRKFTPTRAAFARPGPGTLPFPDVKARMQPKGSLIPVGLGSGRPLPSAYLAAGARSVPPSVASSVCIPRTRCASETGHRTSACPVFLRGGMRASQVSGPSSSCVPWSKTPPGAAPSSPNLGEAAVAFRQSNALGTRNDYSFRGCMAHGPHARVPTHRRTRYRERRKARYRSGRAHPWPGGFRTRWTTNGVS